MPFALVRASAAEKSRRGAGALASELLREGHALPADMPAADRLVLIVAASDVLLTAAMVPPLPAARLRHGRAIAGGEDVRIAGAQTGIRQNAVADGDPRRFRQVDIRHHTDGGDDAIGRDHGAIGKQDAIRSDRGEALPEMEMNAFRAMPRLQARRKSRRDGAPKRHRRHLDDMHADPLGAQHRRKLHPDEPATDDHNVFAGLRA